MSATATQKTKVVSREEWVEARKELLAKEKALTRKRDALAAERQQLPWVKVEKNYVFDTPNGKKTLADLFDGRSQLLVYHSMLGPGWEAGCPGCSAIGDHIGGSVTHLANRDVTLLAVSRAPLAEIETFKKRMGWKFRWVSSSGTEFNENYGVFFAKDEVSGGEMFYNFEKQKAMGEEMPGASAFYKNEKGEVFRTYSTYGRGLEQLMIVYSYLDLVAKGRDEDLTAPHKGSWLRHHDKYESDYYGEAAGVQTKGGEPSCCGSGAKK